MSDIPVRAHARCGEVELDDGRRVLSPAEARHLADQMCRKADEAERIPSPARAALATFAAAYGAALVKEAGRRRFYRRFGRRSGN